jgi:hypothetical protein
MTFAERLEERVAVDRMPQEGSRVRPGIPEDSAQIRVLEAWQMFDQALSRPAAEVAGLRELLSAPTVLDESATEPPAGQAGR